MTGALKAGPGSVDILVVINRRTWRRRWVAGPLVAACLSGALSVTAGTPALAATGDITTFAGSLGEGLATRVAQAPFGVAVSGRTLYLADGVLRAVDLDTGMERIVADPKDLTGVRDLALDAMGNLYALSDQGRVFRLDAAGRITTVAGGGASYADGMPATEASLGNALGVAVDGAGNLYVSIWSQNIVRRVDAAGIITTVAGVFGRVPTATDGGPAVDAYLQGPGDVAVDTAGNLYIAESGRVRRVDRAGIITTVAGGGTYPGGANGIRATDAALGAAGLAFDAAGALLIAGGGRVSKVDAAGRLWTIAGNGEPASRLDGLEVEPADGEPATGVALAPHAVAADAAGNVYVSEWSRGRVRRITPAGIVTTIAGVGNRVPGGDGGQARQAQLQGPEGVAFDRAGNAYIADTKHFRIRKVSPTGVISTLRYRFTPYGPTNVAVDDAGRLFVVAYGGVWRVDPDGLVTPVAGGGWADPVDGGRATEAHMSVVDIATDPAGNLYIADGVRVRKVDAAGRLSTVAGGGSATPADGLAAGSAALAPIAVAVDRSGVVFLADQSNHRVWKVGTDGRLMAVAGSARGFGGDGGPATSAKLDFMVGFSPRSGLAVDGAGQVFILDFGNGRVRRVDRSGVITTVAGNGLPADLYTAPLAPGEGVPATSVRIVPASIDVDGAGNLYLADSYYSRVRKVAGVALPAPSTPAIGHPVAATSSWGFYAFGQLGDGASATRAAPGTVVGVADAAVVAGGGFHSLALANDGSVWSWGLGHVGQLGTGSRPLSASPARVKGLSDVTAIAAGTYHSLAVRADGTVWAWGWNAFGQLGTGGTADSATPVHVQGLDNVVAVAAGTTHSLALKRDGTVLSWGLNHVGQLGTGSRVASTRPVAVPGLASVVSITAGSYHNGAVLADGTAVAWGWNAFGQVGDGTRTDRPSPVAVRGLPAVRSLAAGAGHTVALARDGSVWTWGLGNLGQLGRPGGAVSPEPAAVPGMAGIASVAAGGYHVTGIRTDGTVVAWGWNAFGQLADGTTVDRPSPVSAPDLGPVRSVGAGLVHGLAAGA